MTEVAASVVEQLFKRFTDFGDLRLATMNKVGIARAVLSIFGPGVPALRRATWEWGFETGSHPLRLVFSGLSDRFPKVRVGLGHMGEALPYLLWRFDSRAKLYGVKLAKPPSQYIKENILAPVSGMVAADYPFENAEEVGHFMDTVAIDGSARGCGVQ